MASNNRIFYACQSIAITPKGLMPTVNHLVHGAQSVGMNSTFTLDQVFELGQIEIYENIENVADVEVTVEKVIDGFKLIYDLASDGNCKTDIVASSKVRSDVYVALFDDGLSHATGVPRNVVCNSGMYISSVSYSYSVDGSATESVGFAGNDRFWNSLTNGDFGSPASGNWGANNNISGPIMGSDSPVSGVVRRVNVLLSETGTTSTLPSHVKFQQPSNASVVGNSKEQHIQSITVSTDFGQENIQELGRFGPYARYATFPIEVTAEFEVIATSGDLINVSGSHPNLGNEQIVIKDSAGTILNLGTANKLSSVSYSGGDTGGGNATITYSYSNFNVLTVHGGSGTY